MLTNMENKDVITYKPHVKVLIDNFRGKRCDNCFLELVNIFNIVHIICKR